MRFFLSFILLLASVPVCAQQAGEPSPPPAASPAATAPPADAQPAPASEPQSKRVLGVMPNFKTVAPGEVPPPPTARQNFLIATHSTFDYSAFIFVGITSGLAEGTDAHPPLGKGLKGFGRYYWRGFADKALGNYMVQFALPTALHHDERYYLMGSGPTGKRITYAATRVFVARDFNGRKVFNVSEILGLALAQGISLSYYPSESRTGGRIARKYGLALGRDALTNVFLEFWPDIARRILHRKP